MKPKQSIQEEEVSSPSSSAYQDVVVGSTFGGCDVVNTTTNNSQNNTITIAQLSTKQQQQHPTVTEEQSTTTAKDAEIPPSTSSPSSREEGISSKQHCQEELQKHTEEIVSIMKKSTGGPQSIQQQQQQQRDNNSNSTNDNRNNNDRWNNQIQQRSDDASAENHNQLLDQHQSITNDDDDDDDTNNNNSTIKDGDDKLLQTITTAATTTTTDDDDSSSSSSREQQRVVGVERNAINNNIDYSQSPTELQQHQHDDDDDEQGASSNMMLVEEPTMEAAESSSPPSSYVVVESVPTVALPQTIDFCYPNVYYEQQNTNNQHHSKKSQQRYKSNDDNLVNVATTMTDRNTSATTSSPRTFSTNDKENTVKNVEIPINKKKENVQREATTSQLNDGAAETYHTMPTNGYPIGNESIGCSVDTNALPETMDFCIDSSLRSREENCNYSVKGRIRDVDHDDKSNMKKRDNNNTATSTNISSTNNQSQLQDGQSCDGIPRSNSSYPSTQTSRAESSCKLAQQESPSTAKSKFGVSTSMMHQIEERSQKETRHSMVPFDDLSPLTQTCREQSTQTQMGSFQSIQDVTAVTPVMRARFYSEEPKPQYPKDASKHISSKLDKPIVTPRIEPPRGRHYGYPKIQDQYRSGICPNDTQQSFDHDSTNTMTNKTYTGRDGGQQEEHSQPPIQIVMDVLAPSEYADLQSLDRTKFRTISDFASVSHSSSMVLAVHVKSRPDPFSKDTCKTSVQRPNKKVCFRTFKYLRARAANLPIVSIGELGTSVWGDFTLYHQIVNGGSEYGWLKDAAWWDSHDQSPVSASRRCQQQQTLLSDFKILVLDVDVPIHMPAHCSNILAAIDKVQPTTDREDRLASDFKYFRGISQTEAELLSELAGAEVLRSISSFGPTDHLVIVNDTLDEESMEEIFPRLVHSGIIPSHCNLNLDCTSGNYKSSRIKFIYFSWLLDSISAGLVAPLELYSLGFLEPTHS